MKDFYGIGDMLYILQHFNLNAKDRMGGLAWKEMIDTLKWNWNMSSSF